MIWYGIHVLMLRADLMLLVLLTKIDSYDPDVIGEDLTKTVHSARLLNPMEVSHSCPYAYATSATGLSVLELIPHAKLNE